MVRGLYAALYELPASAETDCGGRDGDGGGVGGRVGTGLLALDMVWDLQAGLLDVSSRGYGGGRWLICSST